MDSVALPTVMEGSGFGGAGLGAGFIGGLVLGSIWNGTGFGGWNRGGAGQVGADVALQNGIQNLSNQAQQNAISQLQSANGIGMQIANGNADVGIFRTPKPECYATADVLLLQQPFQRD